jgi:hypothetical protein
VALLLARSPLEGGKPLAVEVHGWGEQWGQLEKATFEGVLVGCRSPSAVLALKGKVSQYWVPSLFKI